MKLFAVLLFCLPGFSHTFAQTGNVAQQEKALSEQHDTSLVNTLNKLSWEYRHTNTRKALSFGERAEQLSHKLHYGKGLAYSYKNRGAIYSISGQYPKAHVYLKEALQQFSELHNQSEAGNIYNLYGLLYWETGKYDSAIVNYDKALQFYKQVNDLEGVTIVYSNSGIIYYETGKFDKALARYAKALDIAEKRNDRRTLANIHSNIGLVYNQLGNYSKALYHQKTSMRFETEQENLSGIAKSYTNIGVTYYLMHNPDSSLVYHQKALRIYKQIDEKKGISQSLLNIGAIYHDRGDFTKADSNYLLALPMKREMSDLLGETIVLTHLGRLRMDQGMKTEAITFLDNAFRQAHSIKSLQYQVETSYLLAELHEELGNDKKAMLYYKIYTTANERFLREKSANKLTDVMIGMATKGKQKKIASLEKKMTNVYSRAFITGSIIFVLISLVVLLLVRRHKKEKLRLKTELAAHTAALMDFTHQLIAKNEELQTLHQQLEDSSNPEFGPVAENTTLGPERVETLNKLATARIITDEDWETFKQLYTCVHPRFMLQMKELYPGITQAELRLAALITLQLSSKEISAILGISVESVKKSRQRLRKKMELAAEQDLDEVLVGIL